MAEVRTPADAKTAERSYRLRGYMLAGLAAVVVLFAGVGGWAATTDIAGAVIASGTVTVDTSVKKVQHPTGGIVGEIKVKDGDRVQAGDLLLRLDETMTRANLQIITAQLDEIWVREARLRAERDGAEAFDMPDALKARSIEPQIQQIIAGERTHFDSRRAARLGQIAQLRERVAQLHDEIGGLEAQQRSKGDEIDLIAKELKDLETLEAQKLVPASKMTQMRREAARLNGERAQLFAGIAQAKGKITETELQIISVDQTAKTDAVKELRDIEGKESELKERRVAAEDQLRRIDIRAPQAGVVHQLAAHTVGGVINQSEPVLLIVPEGDDLVLEARIAPQDIDSVRVGQAAFVRFTAFSQRTSPELTGSVQRVSGDLIKEPQTNQAFFLARIAFAPDELKRLGAKRLLPGMPAEAHIKTEDRTALSYLMKPLEDQFARAFKER